MSEERTPLASLEQRSDFVRRHLGPDPAGIDAMLNTLGMKSLDDLTDHAVPEHIRTDRPLGIGESTTERNTLDRARELADMNEVLRSMMGMGYSGTITPPVILRNILENPGWYTAYTPYQAEISQGRMEALLNFQTMVTDLTGMEIANASLLDEGTAAAEALHLGLARTNAKGKHAFWVARDCHPQTIEVVQTRARPLGVDVIVGDPGSVSFEESIVGMLIQYPNTHGSVADYAELVEKAHAAGVFVVVASDLLALTLLKPPGEWGADAVVGNSQRFGVPFGFGGPHAAFFATREEFKRQAPGRIVGVSKDSHDQPALRLALQTREQHIRREKATSNICTAQVLLAVMASMYAVYHGPEGVKTIARRVHRMTSILVSGLAQLDLPPRETHFFDTVTLSVADADQVLARGVSAGINLRRIDRTTVGVSLDETTTREDVESLWRVLSGRDDIGFSVDQLDESAADRIPASLVREGEILTHPVFRRYHSETEMLRYLHRLQEKDVSLTRSMIPLGSCTMKLNATAEMIPVTYRGFSQIHPFAPLDQAKGYRILIRELEEMLADITGFAGVSLQPNAGSQGEYAGLLVIRAYHQSRGDSNRNVCIIPSSAHGTNPASAIMAGMKVVVVKCDDSGNIDIEDLRQKTETHSDQLAALMVTYPSTHGVFEEGIREICDIIHDHGGQVYMDGANLNALMGLCRPGEFGADVAHLNLHKTFCIPHGGGGPGVGPIGVREHLRPYLPAHSVTPEAGPETGISAVAAAPWGSAGILPISWAFIRLMGGEGLKLSAQVAILNANYIAKRLSEHYPVLYTGPNGLVAHECIIDVRPLKDSAGVTVDDIAKRLMDFGFHAPTMSWPVAGTLMIEPTESESKEELDRFCEALIQIREEARAVEKGEVDAENNALKHAPHTAEDVVRSDWDRPYSRNEAAFPLPWVRERKFWPPVGRVDNKFGDRNFHCTCPPLEDYE